MVSQGIADSGATTFVPGVVETVSVGSAGVDESGNKIAVGAVDPNWTVSGLLTEAIKSIQLMPGLVNLMEFG